jgi:hypothetical protein
MRSENHSFAGGYVSFLCEATASHTLRSSLSQYSQYYDYGVARLAVAMQLTRLMARILGRLIPQVQEADPLQGVDDIGEQELLSPVGGCLLDRLGKCVAPQVSFWLDNAWKIAAD